MKEKRSQLFRHRDRKRSADQLLNFLATPYTPPKKKVVEHNVNEVDMNVTVTDSNVIVDTNYVLLVRDNRRLEEKLRDMQKELKVLNLDNQTLRNQNMVTSAS